MASAFLGLGVQKDDRVATVMWNCSEMLEIYLAAAQIGAIFTPLNFRANHKGNGFPVVRLEPKLLIVDEKCQEMVQKALSGFPINGASLQYIDPYKQRT